MTKTSRKFVHHYAGVAIVVDAKVEERFMLDPSVYPDTVLRHQRIESPCRCHLAQ